MKNALSYLICYFCFFFFNTHILHAQTYTMGKEEFISWEEFLSNYLEDHYRTTEDVDGNRQNRILDQLEELHNHPLNINTASRQDLLLIPFLSETQTDSILAYRKRKRLFRSLGELQWIDDIPYSTRCNLSLFIFAGDTLQKATPLWNKLSKGKYDIISRIDIPLYERNGYKDFTKAEIAEHPSRYYMGNKISNIVRFRYRWRKDISYGFTLQKDAGEPFGAYHKFPYDYNSFYFHYRSPSRKYSWWMGDYNINSGQGLILGNSFFSGRMQIAENTFARTNQIRQHTSSDEYNYFRGFAGSIQLNKKWNTSFFCSLRRLDGRNEKDTIVSIKTNGLHRTLTELNDEDSFLNYVLGGRINFENKAFNLGCNIYWSQYSKTIYPPLHEYNRYYLRGQNAAGISTDYSWHNKRWHIVGEIASDKDFHIATSNTLHFTPSNNSHFCFQLRNLSAQFVAPFGNTLQDLSHVQNEHGILVGTLLQPFSKIQFISYLDYFYHPRPTFRANTASHGLEYFLQAKYLARPNIYFLARYKLKTEQENIPQHKSLLQYVTAQRGRIATYLNTPRMNLNVAVDVSMINRQVSSPTFGWMVSTREKVQMTPQLSFHTFGAVFFTDDFASRLYAYEPQLPYAASFPTFFKHGARLVGILKWKFHQKGYIGLRYCWLHYFNKKQISSGAQQINASSQNDTSIQLAWRL